MGTAENIINSEILRNLSKGDQQAFRTIYDHYKNRLYYFFLKFCKDPYEAEELLQTFFVRLWEKRQSIRHNTSFEAFIFTVAKHMAYDFLKSRTRQQLLELQVISPVQQAFNSTEDHLFFEEYRSLAIQAIEALPEKRQIIFRMKYEEGLSVTEIADMLALSPKTVKVQLGKASQSVRQYLGRHGELIVSLLLFCE